MDREDKLSEALADVAELMEQNRLYYKGKAAEWWDNLSQEEREMAFYNVCSKIHKGDVRDRGSYRYVLYNVFGFDEASYGIGMDAGYLDIHNLIIEAIDNKENDEDE